MTSRWWRALTMAAALVLIAPVAHAAEPNFDQGTSLSQEERVQLQAQYNQLFAQMLQHPTDLDLMFSFAAVATRLGNYEAAISTLERMLLLTPDLPRVKLELGELYFHIRSYAVAQSYFQAVVADPHVPATVKQNAQLYLTQIDKLTSLNHFAGSITAGFRYQTNANVGPSSNQVVAAGVPAILNSTFVQQSDWNVFGSTYLTDSYDILPDKSVTWDTTLQGYYAYQFTLHELNLGFAETTTGPRFMLMQQPGIELSLRPFVLANAVFLGDSLDFDTFGAGAELDKAFYNDRLLLGVGYTYRYEAFFNSSQLPTNSLFTGPVNILGVTSSYQLTNTIQLGLSGYASHQLAQADFNANWQYSISAGISKEYAAPFGLTEFPWVATLSAQGIWTNYQSPDPTVDPFTVRADREFDLTLGNTIGLTRGLSLLLQAQYTNHNSNIPNFRFTDTSVVMGTTLSF